MAKTPVTITYESAVTLLKRAVLEKGADYVFRPTTSDGGGDNPDNYWYFNPKTGEPGCIVGHVLSYKGLTKEDLGRFNAGVGFDLIATSADRGVECDARAYNLLAAAQTEQDQGASWGSAVQTAIGMATESVDESA